jgi:UPF0755 protein
MWKVRGVLKFAAFMAVLALAAGGWLGWSIWKPIQPDQPKYVQLRPGFGTRRIARELQSAGVVRSSAGFLVWHYFHRGRSLKAGEYLFNSSANLAQVHDRLARGDIYVHTVVIPEGYNMFDIARAVQDAGLGSADDFLKAAQSDVALISDIAPQAKTLEGYLFPATYQFTRAQSMNEMVENMVRQFRQVATVIGLNKDVERTVTLASIVEKETAVPEERALALSMLSCSTALMPASCTMPTCRCTLRITLTPILACRRVRSATRDEVRLRQPCIPPRPTISTLWQTATVVTDSPTIWKNTIVM